MTLITPEQYVRNRRAATISDIAHAKGSRSKLTKMIKDRRSLAQTYYEDGARETARVIEEVDIALIQAAIAALPKESR